MEKRNLIQKIFGSKASSNQKVMNTFKMLNGFAPVFTTFGGQVTKSDVYQTAVQAHARHFSKLLPATKQIVDKDYKDGKESLNRLLGLRPNPLMSTAVFLEKCAYQYFNFNDVFIYIQRNQYSEPMALWVLDAQSIEVLGDSQNNIYFRFQFGTGRVTVPYENLIHIPRNISSSEFMGGNNDTIKQVLSIIDTNYQGIEKSIKLSSFVRFIVEHNTALNAENKQKMAEQFKELFLRNGDDGLGVVISGATEKVTQMKSDAKYSNAEEMKLFDDKVYDYLSINKKIINCTYTEDEWQAYYESSIENFVIKLTQEMNYKLFTTSEYKNGFRVYVNVDKLQYASFATRIKILQETRETGDMTTNERRELLYLPKVKDGDVREVSLNYTLSTNQGKTEVKEK